MTLLGAALLASGVASHAHALRAGGSMAGLPIPSLSHGEMAVLADYRDSILDLAHTAIDTNERFRRVLNFSKLQYAACLWGRMPASVTDEASPFNECSHAYLAAVKMLLLDMRAMPYEAKQAGELVSRIDVDMTLNGMALIGCQFSDEMFNTADVIFPNWFDIPYHGPSAAASLGLAALAIGGTWGGRRAFRSISGPGRAQIVR